MAAIVAMGACGQEAGSANCEGAYCASVEDFTTAGTSSTSHGTADDTGAADTVIPGGTDEICGNGVDDDGDNLVDEDCGCTPGSVQPCWSGPASARNVGICEDGTQACILDGMTYRWDSCEGEILPSTEIFDNEIDEDCNGVDGTARGETSTGGDASSSGSSSDAGGSDSGGVTSAGSTTGTAGPAPCTNTPWGQVSDGFSGTAYSESLPAGPCASQVRTCTDGVLSGSASYNQSSCTAGCTATPWGNVRSGFSGTAYSTQYPQAGGPDCEDNRQTRTCTNGTLSGTYTYLTCTNYPCEYESAYFQRAQWQVSSTDPATSQWRECLNTGAWSSLQPGHPHVASAFCLWVGPMGTLETYFPVYTCGWYDGQAYVCNTSGNWVAAAGCPQSP